MKSREVGLKMKRVNQVRSKTRICHVEAFLRQELAAGPVDLSVLKRRARQAGLLGKDQHITEAKAFRTAKKALGIMSARTGFGRGGHWAWRLAPSPPDPNVNGQRGVSFMRRQRRIERTKSSAQ